MMWQRFQEKVESQGGQVYLNTKVVCVRREGRRIKSINVQRGEKGSKFSAKILSPACLSLRLSKGLIRHLL